MDQMMNAILKAITAAASYFIAAVSLAVSNPIFLGFTVVLLLTAGKSLKLGRIFSAKG